MSDEPKMIDLAEHFAKVKSFHVEGPGIEPHVIWATQMSDPHAEMIPIEVEDAELNALADEREDGPFVPVALHCEAEWNSDMSLAPRDGTWVILRGDRSGEPQACAAFWADETPGDEGWYESEAASHKATDYLTPTGWMLFPSTAE